jgi:acetoacetyl-CoA synthetase
MKVEVFDPFGNNIEHTGQPGELVCTRPHPSLPIAFWGDESGQKLRDAYFSRYPGQLHDFFSLFLFKNELWFQGFGTKAIS